jgi:hypothetical protein
VNLFKKSPEKKLASPKNGRKLAIVGAHPRTRDEAPWDDKNFDIWAFNEALSVDPEKRWIKRADLIFQMHLPAIWKNPQNRNDPHYYEWLQNQRDVPIYMFEKYPEVPMAIEYPFEGIREMLLGSMTVDSEKGRKDFFTSTIAYSTALGLYLGYEEIHWYGIELEVQAEYQFQRDSACFWAGVCVGRGVPFIAHSQIFDMPLYGKESFVSIDKQKFLDNIERLAPECNRLVDVYNEQNKVYEAAYKKLKDNNAESVKEEFKNAVIAQGNAAGNYGLVDGARQENARYHARAKAMQEASGSYVFSRHEFERDANSIKQKLNEVKMQFASVSGQCNQLLVGLENKFDKRRRLQLEELKKYTDEFIKLNGMIGLHQGGAEEDLRLRELMNDDKQ